MLAWLRQRRAHRRTARVLYGSIVTQSRRPVFYAVWGVPDTVEGRFEMLAVHLVLLVRRVAAGALGAGLQRALTETFVIDIDDALREMTVGDLAVPRNVKRAVAVLHDRHVLYGQALESTQDNALAGAVSARLGALKPTGDLDAAAICAYLNEAVRALEQMRDEDLVAGRIEWPQPGTPGPDLHAAAG